MKQNKLSYKIGQFLMFGGPATILFFAVVILPFFYGLYLTFTSWDGVSTTKPFVGLENYKAALADTAYWQSLGRTFIYSVIAVILTNIVAFLLAYLVTSGIKGRTSSVRASSFRTSSAASFWATCGSSSSTVHSWLSPKQRRKQTTHRCFPLQTAQCSA